MSYPVRSHPEESGPALVRRELTEGRIVASAVELLQSGVPWSQLGVKELAERANLSRTAFYDFFGSKNEVLSRLIRGLHADLVRLLSDPSIATELESGLDAFLQDVRPSLDLVADLNQQYGPVYKAFLEASDEDPRLRTLWHQLLGDYRELGAASLERVWRDRPDMGAAEAMAAAEVLILMTERTMLMLLSGPEPVLPQRRAALLDALAGVWHRTVTSTGTAPAPPH